MLYNESVAYKSYEIIGGEKFIAPMPKLFHSGIIMRLAARIFDYVDKKNAVMFLPITSTFIFPTETFLIPIWLLLLQKIAA